MDKGILQKYSVWAKQNLEQQIEVSLKTLGINSETDIARAKRTGDVTTIEGDPNSYSADLYANREHIVNLVKTNGYNNVIEEFAYTWFNRFVALRFMEVHDFLGHGFRVLSNRSGGVEPEILQNLVYVKDDLKLNIEHCSTLREQNKIEDLYRYVLIQQCNALSDTLPMLFSRDMSYLELLLPKTLLRGETAITKMLEIREDAFMRDVEIIGWMYQFYISSKKDAVNKEKKTITKDTLPAVTQLFTPDWIVRYMAENSVGRIWMESYPASSLRTLMKYYVNDTEQTEEVQKMFKQIKYRNVNPEDIRIIEPCCGSGHVLVYVFDLLYKMYEEKGYPVRDIPTLILTKNLYGLDVDKRAVQLSAFALVMKAREANNRFFNNKYYVTPNVFEIIDSSHLLQLGYRKHLAELKILSDKELKAINSLVDIFKNGKTIGSLLKIIGIDFKIIDEAIEKIERNAISNIFNSSMLTDGINELKHLLKLARILSLKYDIMITNPPYIGISDMEAPVKDYAEKHYSDSKTDMFSMFMEVPLVKDNGFRAMINQQSWMYLVSFLDLRQKILINSIFASLIHLGSNAFEDITGQVVQTCSFVIRQVQQKKWQFPIIDLRNEKTAISKMLSFENKQYQTYVLDNEKILCNPDSIFDYGKKEYDKNLVLGRIEEYDEVLRGPSFENNSVLRYWHEVNYDDISTVEDISAKWVPCSRNGGKVKWHNFSNEIIMREKLIKASNFESQKSDGILWNDSRFGNPTIIAKLKNKNESYESALNLIVCNKDEAMMYLALFNLGFYEEMLKTRINGQHFSPIYIKKLEKFSVDYKVIPLVENILNYHRKYETFFEESKIFNASIFNFEGVSTLGESYEKLAHLCQNMIKNIKGCEEEIIQHISSYIGVRSDSHSKNFVHEITKAEYSKRVISYLIGIVLGRYKYKENTIHFAGGEWDNLLHGDPLDDDGIIPIYSSLGMEDSLTAKLIELIKTIFGEHDYRNNIDFIADALGKKSSESSEETLNRYLNEGFYTDHLKIYQKRPIYWMFSSGKNNGFKCLIYMHRYNTDTLARINGKYFLPESTRIKNELDEINVSITSAEGRNRIRLENQQSKLVEKYNEAIEYGQVLDHMANRFIDINLDDGVKVNYAKFQGIELITDNGIKVKKDLLVPFK